MTPRKRILIVSFSPIASDPRVLRQINELQGPYDVTVAGFGQFKQDDVTYIELPQERRNLYEKFRAAQRLTTSSFSSYEAHLEVSKATRSLGSTGSYDLYIANDVQCLPSVLDLAHGAPVILDAHEYSLDMSGPPGLRGVLMARYHQWLCETFIPQAQTVITVSEPIARAYSKHLGITQPIVIPNAPPFEDLQPSPVTADRIRLVHHGVVGPARGIDILIQAFLQLPENYELHLYLVTDSETLQGLKNLCGSCDRITFHRPIPTRQIAQQINQYDVFVFAAQPTCFSDEFALPNKFFESVQARLAQFTTPMPAIKDAIETHGLGQTSDSFDADSFAKGLLELTVEQIRYSKESSAIAAALLSWEQYVQSFRQTVLQAFEGAS